MQHWIFDFDGTLVDSFPAYRKVLERVLDEHEVQLSLADLDFCRHMVLPHFLGKFIDAKYVPDAEKRVIDLSMQSPEDVQPFTGIVEILDHIKSKDCEISIFTGRELVTTQKILQHSGLHRYFSHVVSRNCVAQTKPNPEGIHKILMASQSLPDQSVMIGDHPMDMAAAKAAGLVGVSVDWMSDGASIKELSDHHFAQVDDFHRWVIQVLQ